MVAYIDDFKLMLIVTVLCMPMLLLMRKPKLQQGGPRHVG
jgi:DHA2 family multidrug resistance protein